MGLNFFVDQKSLIPRPETELLIEPIMKIFKNKKLFFLEIGIGSGCIMLSLLNHLKHSRAVGIDIWLIDILSGDISIISLESTIGGEILLIAALRLALIGIEFELEVDPEEISML